MAYIKDEKASGGPVRKKPKTSDLPLASATRAAIEGLAHTFKKKGGYDTLRKQVWDDLSGSNFEKEFTSFLLGVAEEELEKNPSQLLKLDRGKATLLIEGAVDRAGVYQSAEAQLDKLIDAHLPEIETGIRGLRKDDIGEEAATAEQAKGGKTDEQYAEEAAVRREARDKTREEAREKEYLAAEEKRKIEKAKRREEEKKLEAEQEKRKEEREARKKAEREREEELERELRERDREREREREKERDKLRERERERERDRDRGRSRDRDRNRDRDRDRDDHRRRYDEGDSRQRHSTKDDRGPAPKAELSKEEIERLEQEALDDLLNEGKRVAQRSRHQLELEIDKTLAPPPRKSMPASAINPISKPTDTKKLASSKSKGDEAGTRTSSRAEGAAGDQKVDSRDRRRSRSRDRASIRRYSRSPDRPRRDSRERDRRRDSRNRDDSRVRDRDRDDRRRRSRDRDDRRNRSRSRDRRRSYRSRSRDRRDRDRDGDRDGDRDREREIERERRHLELLEEKEAWKRQQVKERELEAKAYLAAQQEAREKGLPIPGRDDRKRDDDRMPSPTAIRKRDYSRDRGRDDRERSSRLRSRSRTPRRSSRVMRSTSPVDIDRYVPGASSRSDRRSSIAIRSPARKRSRSRDRDRDRDRDRERRRSREDDRPRRRSRSRSHRIPRSRDADKARPRSRSRSPYDRRDRGSRRERSRSRDRDRDRDRQRDRDRRHRSRTRSPSKTKDRKRSRSVTSRKSKKD